MGAPEEQEGLSPITRSNSRRVMVPNETERLLALLLLLWLLLVLLVFRVLVVDRLPALEPPKLP